MIEFKHGFNYKCLLPNDNDFSFYCIALEEDMILTKLSAQNLYDKMKQEFMFNFHGSRGISDLKIKYNTADYKYEYSFVVCLKGENEVIFKLKYEKARLLYVIPLSLKFDMYIDDPSDVLLTLNS